MAIDCLWLRQKVSQCEYAYYRHQKEAEMNAFKCSFCGHAYAVDKVTQYIYRHDGNFLIVNQVPCQECEYCGEQYFAAGVLKRIEQDFHEIHEGRRQVPRLNIPVEQFA